MWPFQSTESRIAAAVNAALEQRASVENPSVSLSDPRAFDLLFGDSAEAAGEKVTPETALTVPAIWSAVNFIASTVAALPLKLYKKTDEGREASANAVLERILHDAPNPEWSSYQWRKYTLVNTLGRGRSYSFIERNQAGRVMNLWPLNPDMTQVRWAVDGATSTRVYDYYDVKDDQKRKIAEYKASEIIDLPFMMDADQISHISPIVKLKRTIGLTIALERYATRLFENGGVPPLQVIGPFTSPSGAARAALDINKAVQEARGSQRNILPMPTGHELKGIGFDPEKMQMESARRFQVEEVARVYNLPPVFLQDLTHGTFSNTEQQDLHFVKHTLTQWLEAFEQELNLKLFARSSRDFVEFSVDGLLRGDFKTRMDGYATAIQNSIRTPDEVRGMENLARKGGAADQLHIQGATVPLGTPPQTAPQNGNQSDDQD